MLVTYWPFSSSVGTTRHRSEHVIITLEDGKVARMNIIATKDPRFGNDDLDCGSGNEELPCLDKKKTIPTCVVTKVNPPSKMQGLDSKEAWNLSDVQVLEVKMWTRPPVQTKSCKKLKRGQVPSRKLMITSTDTNTFNNLPNIASTRHSRSPSQDFGKDLGSNSVDISPNTSQGGEVLCN